MKPSLASLCTSSIDLVGHGGRTTNKALACADGDHELADRQVLGFGALSPFFCRGERVAVHAHARPSFRNQLLSHLRVDIRQRAVGVVSREVPVPKLLQELDGGGATDLLAAHFVGIIVRLSVRGAQGQMSPQAG